MKVSQLMSRTEWLNKDPIFISQHKNEKVLNEKGVCRVPGSTPASSN